jgi:ATP-binding cassette, subfamily B, bacterial PglK
MSTYKKILQLLTKKERRQGYLLLVMIPVMALLDTIGVASIMPFMSVLGNPEVVEANRWLAMAYTKLGFTETDSFLFFLGLVVFTALIVSIAFKVLTQWALLRFTHMRNYSLSCRLFKGYLGCPYTWFLNRHSADMGKSILSEVTQVINNVIIPAMQFLAHGCVALFIIILLIVVYPILALSVALVLGGAYFFVYISIRQYLSRIGKDRVVANRERFQVAQEALSGIKEVKIFGRELSFFSKFARPAYRFARYQASSHVIGQIPRYLMELVAFGGILLITLYLFRSYENFNRALPLLAVYAFAGYRLLPALQTVYQQLSKLRFGLPALDGLYKDILEFQENEQSIKGPVPKPLLLQNCIALKDIDFTYPGAHIPALQGLDMVIPAKSTIGLVGTTGSGKTTTVDVMLGLLWPDKGQVLVDDTPITSENVLAWQRALGYVPQHIYLADDSVAANIAFGIPPEDIDMYAVAQAAKIAELHEFVTRDLSKGYNTLVGERGVRLSGGQRQRIGIARALYHDPDVLICDEATSFLDNVTEKAVIKAMQNLGQSKTIILIAHRLTTVEDCHLIYFIERGKVRAKGTYDELIEEDISFRNMALKTP